eukprot:TRINITY_DN1622_c0_g1_i7.p3 TRINITY_DN1622_c0_g1~~TRINITY_DN1622_c0_g1_i7.p3  ORF type:complete len:140 (+),score=12.85 TRINITY_DN1622_c0_g1_i7:146-565(+)
MNQRETPQYNIDRRVVDHRALHDLNYSLNQPMWTKNWRRAFKNRFVQGGVYMTGLYYTTAMFVGAYIIGYVDAYYRGNYLPEGHGGVLNNPKLYQGEKFVYQNLDHTKKNPGRWNHTFGCFESEKGCGRDFAWILRKNE